MYFQKKNSSEIFVEFDYCSVKYSEIEGRIIAENERTKSLTPEGPEEIIYIIQKTGEIEERAYCLPWVRVEYAPN